MPDKKHYKYKDVLKLANKNLIIPIEEKSKKKKRKISFILDDDLCAYFDFHFVYDEVINIAIKEYLDRSKIDWRSYNKQGDVKMTDSEKEWLESICKNCLKANDYCCIKNDPYIGLCAKNDKEELLEDYRERQKKGGVKIGSQERKNK